MGYSWMQAEGFCEARGMRLVAVRSADELTALKVGLSTKCCLALGSCVLVLSRVLHQSLVTLGFVFSVFRNSENKNLVTFPCTYLWAVCCWVTPARVAWLREMCGLAAARCQVA